VIGSSIRLGGWTPCVNILVNLSIKEGCLFCFVFFACFVCHGEISRTVSSGRVLGTVGKVLARRGARAWFCVVWTYGGKVIEFQSFSMDKKF